MMKNRLCCILVSAVVAAIALSVPSGGDQADGAVYPPPAVITCIAQPITGPMPASAPDNINIASVPGTIGPGGKVHHKKIVSGHFTTLNVDLKWANPDVSLKLLVASPSGVTFGPWCDASDAFTDHEINMDISDPDGIEQGTWDYFVIYDKGVGSTGYTL